MKRLWPLALPALLLLGWVAGCSTYDVSPQDGPIEATGRVVLAETGEPVVGLGVSILVNTGAGAYPKATARTDAEGRFAVRYVVPENRPTGDSYTIEINAPYDSRYKVQREHVRPPKTVDFGTVELERNEQR